MLLALLLPVALAASPQAPQPPADPLAALAALAPQPAPARGTTVLVRDAEGKPVAGARVVFATSEQTQLRRQQTPPPYPGDEPAECAWSVGAGTAYAVDEKGATRVPAEAGRVFAWHGELLAHAWITPKDGRLPPRIELVLRPVVTVPVRALDANGKPLTRVPLGVFAAGANAPFVRHPGSDHETVAMRLLGRGAVDLVVRAMIASPQPVIAPVVAGATTDVRLPPCGAVRARFAGDLVPGSTADWSIRHDALILAAERVDANTGLFRHVAVGFAGKATVFYPGSSVEVDLPAIEAGGEHAVTTDREPGNQRLTLRLLGPDGQPLRNRLVRSSVRSGNTTRGSSWRTTSEGWLEINLRGVKGDLKVTLNCSGPVEGDGDLLATEFEVKGDAADAATKGGRIDRGDVTLAQAPVVLTGTVVDTAGKPVPGLRLSTTLGTRGWVTTRADGSFRVASAGAPPKVVQLGLSDRAWWFLDPETKHASLSTSVSGPTARLVVVRAGRVRRGGKALPENLHHDFEARLEPASGDGRRIDLDFQPKEPELLLPPGTWDYVILVNGTEVHRIEKVQVDAGIEVHDARFMDFDWSAFATLVTIRVEDKDGKPLEGCTVWHEMGNTSSGFGLSQGVVHCLLPKDGGRIRIEPEDKAYASIPLGLVTQDQHVRLGQGPRLQLTLSQPIELPAGVQLLAIVGEGHDGIAFDAAGAAATWLAAAGEFTVTLAVRKGDTTCVQDLRRTVEVPAGGKKFTFPIDEATARMIQTAAREK